MLACTVQMSRQSYEVAMQALQPEIAACKLASEQGIKPLIHHIFNRHPPRTESPQLPDCAPSNLGNAIWVMP